MKRAYWWWWTKPKKRMPKVKLLAELRKLFKKCKPIPPRG